MTTELRNAMDNWPDRAGPAQLDLEETFRPLLKELLTQLHRSGDTPLRFGIDSVGIVDATLKEVFSRQTEDEAVSRQDWETVKAAFDGLLERALLDEPELWERSNRSPSAEKSYPSGKSGSGVSGSAGTSVNKTAPHPLATWLDHFHALMREVHPSAIEVANLRMEDYTCREVAQQLGLGLRLVRRIVEDMRLALGGEVTP